MTDTTNKAKVIVELPAMASVVKEDLLVVHDVSANVAVSELYYNANGVVYFRRS